MTINEFEKWFKLNVVPMLSYDRYFMQHELFQETVIDKILEVKPPILVKLIVTEYLSNLKIYSFFNLMKEITESATD